MGNWRTVNMIGSCSAEDLPALKKALDPGEDYANFNCLSESSSLCGLNNWAKEKISTIGNLSERDYDPQDVAKTLEELVKVAPSLQLIVHCGGDYESTKCVATVRVLDGKVDLMPPQIEEIHSIPEGTITSNLLNALYSQKR